MAFITWGDFSYITHDHLTREGGIGFMKSGDRSSLVSVLQELGSACCEPPILEDILTQVLSSNKSPESQIAQSLFMIAENTASDGAWNTAAFIGVVLRTFPKIKRAEIVKELDFPEFQVPDICIAEELLKSWHLLFPKFYEEFPFKIMFMKWNNIKGQLSLLHHLLQLGSDKINFSQFSASKVISNEDINLSTAANRMMVTSLSSQTWNCYEIYDLSCKLVDTEYFEDVRPIFELASRQCSELLCIALAMFNPSWNSILKEILVKLTCGFLLGQPTSSIILPRVWNLNPNIMMLCMVEMHRRDASCLSRLLDVAQDLKILTVVLESKPYNFALDVAALASRRQHLNLEKWISDSIKEKGPSFLKASIEFALEKLRLQASRADRSNVPPFIPISPEILGVFTKVFQGYSAHANPECQELLRAYFQNISADSAVQPSSGIALGGVSEPINPIATNEPSPTYAQDIEDEVNAFFEKIFSKEFPVEDVIELLKRLRASSVARDQQLFSCMIQNLFDEYRFFSKYPDNELVLTANIFGAIIKHQLIGNVPLGIGLRYVLEALKKPPTHKLHKFGVHSLIQFQRRLYEWPQYCSHLLQIPHLCQSYPDLMPFLQSIVAGNPINAMPFPESDDKSAKDSISSAAGNEGLSSVLEARGFAPPPADAVRDKILFVLNNMSSTNLELKVTDLRKLLPPTLFAWFAQYLVIKRASMETNYHQLYVQMLENFGDERLTGAVMKETFIIIEALLKSPKTINSSSERTLLKNLGIWLGSLTLARDRPILYDDLCIKNVLMDAVLNNRLIVVIPFACKVLEQAMHSRVFRPYNPYTMASIKLLVELYKYADLKLNLKFEVEVLCKSLGLEIKEIKPSSLLKDRSRLARFSQPPSPTATVASLSTLPEHMNIPLVNSLVNLLQINKLNPAEFSHLLKIFPLAVEYAIRELAFSVSERSINISSVTAKALIFKDFGPQSDTKYVRNCALRLVQYLASSLALASLKESIRPAILSNLKTFLQISELPNPFSDAIWSGTIEENIENITSFIEYGTSEKVVADFEHIFSNDWIGHESRGNRADYEAYEGIFSQRRTVPRGSSNFLLNDIKAIVPGEYDQLVANLRQLSQSSGGHPREPTTSSVTVKPSPKVSSPTEAYSVAEVIEMFIKLLGFVEKACQSSEERNVSKLNPESDVRKLMKQIVPLASSIPSHRDEVCLLMCQRLMQLLYKNSNLLFADVIILLLVKIFEFSGKVAKEVTSWIIYSDDDRKYNVLATWSLFNSGLVYVLDYDAQMARQIEKNPEVSIKFAVELIRKCVFEEPAVAAPYDFVYTLEALKNFSTANKAFSEAIKQLLEDLMVKTKSMNHSNDLKNSRESVIFCFTDWFRLCQYPSISEKLIDSFMFQLFEYGFFDDESTAKVFFQVCTESVIEIYVRQRRSPAILSYRSVEAYARLIANIIKWSSLKSSEGTSKHLTSRELSIIALKIVGVILAQGLEQGMDYLQKPFSRFLICLITNIGTRELGLAGNQQIIDILGEFIISISPQRLPKFAFAWFEAFCHPGFLGLFLTKASVDGQGIILRSLIDVLDFLAPVSEMYIFSEPLFLFYRGLLKLFTVFLQECSEFLLMHYLQLCDHIPAAFIQLRNIVLSAVPEGMALPDPMTPGLKIDTLSGIRLKPELPGDYIFQVCAQEPFVVLLDEALQSAGNPSAQLCSLLASANSDKLCLNLINLLALRLVNSSVNEITFKSGISLLLGIINSPNLKSDFRYRLLSGMVNYLRYPNYLMYFFSCALLTLFRQAQEQSIKSQVVRVLLERLIVHRPHPWGLMITFLELIRNPEYGFWKQAMVKSSPEIEKMFESVAKTCLVNPAVAS